ncbi:hypothetical protein KFE25_010712 [Diacronema lutheri]|uniref:Uncharacterized protein n=1 Tax=Diacronema lutheri TaxID=2081491 RepID=A0A8J5X4T5_DIALT|nr:hypothetical protein KFE25_010712 [Diacronema lutheri]
MLVACAFVITSCTDASGTARSRMEGALRGMRKHGKNNSQPKPPLFCSRDPPGKEGRRGFTCMEHKCMPHGNRTGDDALGSGEEFFKCMCLCCRVPCKQPKSCNDTTYAGPPDFSLRWPYKPPNNAH